MNLRIWLTILVALWIAVSVECLSKRKSRDLSVKKLNYKLSKKAKTGQKCSLPPALVKEIADYQPIVNRIVNETLNGFYKGRTYRTLDKFVSIFGSRIAGSDNLENAIDFMVEALNTNNLENVHTEPVLVPKWVRGQEYSWVVKPHLEKLKISGLGSSIGTPPKGLWANGIVVDSYEELQSKKMEEVWGKIVIFNEPYVSYSETVKYRSAASKAAKLGAVATLIRSITPYANDLPHTGWQNYEDNVTKIPTAAISINSSETLSQMYKNGEEILIFLYMEAKSHSPVISRNTVAEIKGTKQPEKVVLVSGHLDSWDVGQGAMDDGGGAFVSWNSLALIQLLGLRPKRTLRSVLWTAEEEGLIGAEAYFNDHRNSTGNFDFVMESDIGTFKPLGLSYSGSDQGGCIIREILKLMQPLNATAYSTPMEGGPDIEFFTDVGIPGAALLNANERYFWYHHSDGDRMSVLDPRELDLCTALWAATAYVVADLSVDMPR